MTVGLPFSWPSHEILFRRGELVVLCAVRPDKHAVCTDTCACVAVKMLDCLPVARRVELMWILPMHRHHGACILCDMTGQNEHLQACMTDPGGQQAAAIAYLPNHHDTCQNQAVVPTPAVLYSSLTCAGQCGHANSL